MMIAARKKYQCEGESWRKKGERMKDIRSGSGGLQSWAGQCTAQKSSESSSATFTTRAQFFLSLSHLSPSSTMSESFSPSARPSLFPTPSRDPPSPPTSRPVSTLLASRGSHATPIPPSLQAKMAAVCIIPLSAPSYPIASFRWQSGCRNHQMSMVLRLR